MEEFEFQNRCRRSYQIVRFDCAASCLSQPLNLTLVKPDDDVRIQMDYFRAVHSLRQSILKMSSGSPTKAVRFLSRESFDGRASGTIRRTIPLRTISTGTPVSATSSSTP